MRCSVCGIQVSQGYALCLGCLREIGEAAEQRRNQIINDAIDKVSKEADEIYKKDPTKGRGRGPKWMDG